MYFLYFLTYLAFGVQTIFIVVSIAAGLYYIAELVEEYTTVAKRCITTMIVFTIVMYLALCVFESFPWRMIIGGLLAQAFHLAIMKSFPFIRFLSISFAGAIVCLIANHVMAFQYFTSEYYPFVQVLAYFTICLWIVPFALFVSLSANDNVLPTVNEQSMRGHPDVVTNYFARGKKQGLLSLFNYAKETLLPTRGKKSF